jgi:hypothetical protein
MGEGATPGPSAGNPRRFGRPSWWLIAVGALLAWNLVLFVLPVGGPPALTYSDFRAQVAAGNVSSVDISGQAVTGTLRATPVTSTTPAASTTGTAARAATTAPVDQEIPFQTVVPPFGDATLVHAVPFGATGHVGL